jgi:hypothetical protein
VGKVYTSTQSLKPIRIVCVHWYGRVWCGMAISVLIFVKREVRVGVFGNNINATGARRSVVVECEKYATPLFWVKRQSIDFL